MVKGPIQFYFDFASPYAYFAFPGIEEIGRRWGREIIWKPVMVWAILKAHGIAPPMDVPAKHRYFITDMQRSAEFHGVAYRHPDRLPLSAHLATRLYLTMARTSLPLAKAFGRAVFQNFFTRNADISDAEALLAIATSLGLDKSAAVEGMNGQAGRDLLASALDEAVAAGVIGSPFFVMDDEPFFGADRLPQIEWRLGRQAQGGDNGRERDEKL
jgi:2-hydroxychromene-2-carboxylate isomerase